MLIGPHAVYGHFWTATAELSSCNRDHMHCKDENVYYLFLPRRNLPTPVLDRTITYPSIVLRKYFTHMISFTSDKHLNGLGYFISHRLTALPKCFLLYKMRKPRLKVLVESVLSSRGGLKPSAVSIPPSRHSPYHNVLNVI